MKAQSEMVTFVLLFVIGILIFIAAIVWGRGVTEQNIDTAKIVSAERFMKSFNEQVESIVRSGGSQTISYPLNMEFRFVESGISDVLEIRDEIVGGVVPDNPIDITSPGSLGTIREWMDGPLFRIQLTYPLQDSTAIDFFTEGSITGTPKRITIEKNSTFSMQVGGKEYEVVRLKITMQ